mgnify:CR=1 FL=1
MTARPPRPYRADVVETLPWVISTFAVLAVLVMTCLQGAKRRPAGKGPRSASKRARAARTRREVRAATRANLDRIAGALESDNAEQLLADEVNRTRGGDQ